MTGTTARHPGVRTVVAIITLFIPFGAVLGSYLAWQDRLPPELASHWSGTGPADGVMTVSQFLTIALVSTGGAAIAGALAGAWPYLRPAVRRNSLLIAGIIGGVGAQTWLVSAALTMQAGDPYEVVLGIWTVLGLAAAGYGLIPFLIAPKPQRETTDLEQRIDLQPGESGAWSRTVTARLFLWSAVLLIAVGIAVYAVAASNGDVAEATLGLAVIAALVIVLAGFARYQVTVDWRGLRVVSSLLGIPIKRIRLEDIDTVDFDEITPAEWGGWGYRITPGRSALILRKGPGLVVTTNSGKQFALTLDEPEVPAALLATLRDRGPTTVD